MWKRFLLFLALVTSVTAISFGTAHAAFTPIRIACSNGAASVNGPNGSDACSAPVEPISGPGGALERATNLIAIIAGAAAVIIIIVSGISFVTANGDASKAANARTALVSALIGLAIIVAARAIINFVISRL